MIQLTKKQALRYKRRWREVEAMQIQEMRTTPVSLRFKQLCVLMDSFHFARKDKKREKEVDTILRSWLILKENQK